jgi:hypothetical protein
MSSGSIPYHLRQNKAVDRYAFIELLSKLDKYCDIEQYGYVGFGGHSLEDFKYIHSRFGITNMTSIENNQQVYNRQRFNQPHNCIKCILQSSDEFIDEFQAEVKTIIWLDYTNPAEIRSQVEQLQAIINKLSPLDIVKITLNAHASSYHEAPKGKGIRIDPEKDIQQPRLEKLNNRLGDLFPIADVSLDMMTEARFPEALCSIVKFAVNSSLHGRSDIQFQPLTSFCYADGVKMLTITGILIEDNNSNLLTATNIENWELANTQWGKPKSINIPDLTIKERLYIDALLPHSKPEEIQKKLGFLFSDKESESLEMLRTYILFYRQSPYFSRILV